MSGALVLPLSSLRRVSDAPRGISVELARSCGSRRMHLIAWREQCATHVRMLLPHLAAVRAMCRGAADACRQPKLSPSGSISKAVGASGHQMRRLGTIRSPKRQRRRYNALGCRTSHVLNGKKRDYRSGYTPEWNKGLSLVLVLARNPRGISFILGTFRAVDLPSLRCVLTISHFAGSLLEERTDVGLR